MCVTTTSVERASVINDTANMVDVDLLKMFARVNIVDDRQLEIDEINVQLFNDCSLVALFDAFEQFFNFQYCCAFIPLLSAINHIRAERQAIRRFDESEKSSCAASCAVILTVTQNFLQTQHTRKMGEKVER